MFQVSPADTIVTSEYLSPATRSQCGPSAILQDNTETGMVQATKIDPMLLILFKARIDVASSWVPRSCALRSATPLCASQRRLPAPVATNQALFPRLSGQKNTWFVADGVLAQRE